jgi:hypothetical protein
MSNYRWGVDWWPELLDTYNSQLQFTPGLSLFRTLYIHWSIQYILSVSCVFISPVLYQRLPTPGVPIRLQSRTVSVPQPQQLSANFRTTATFSTRLLLDCISLRHSRRLFLHNRALFKVKIKVKVKVILRPTVSRPAYLGARHPSETPKQFFPFSF